MVVLFCNLTRNFLKTKRGNCFLKNIQWKNNLLIVSVGDTKYIGPCTGDRIHHQISDFTGFVFKCLVTQTFMTHLKHWRDYSLSLMASFCPTLLCSCKLWICLSVHHLTPVRPSPRRRAWVLHHEQINTLTLLPGYLQQFSLQRLWAGWLSADVGQMHSSYLCVCARMHAHLHAVLLWISNTLVNETLPHVCCTVVTFSLCQ